MLTPAQRKEHTLNRIGYGQSVWASNRYDTLGHAGYIAEQLGQTLPAITQDGVFIEPKIERSVTEQRQLETVLIDFWFNHFNVNAANDGNRNDLLNATMHQYQNLAIAPHILGTFSNMLVATAKEPMMLFYLDNRLNRRPQVLGDGRVVGYNENYAREVMELHTIGVNAGYTQADIRDVARLMTGWLYRGKNDADDPFGFLFAQGRHDTDAKQVLGVTYPAGGGMEEGEALLNFLGTHPAAANFLSYKLCTRFIGENPSAAAIGAAAATFNDTGGDLAQVMNTILTHPAFSDQAQFRSKVKPPHRYAASALLAMGATVAGDWTDNVPTALRNAVINAGDTPYYFAPPTGYPEVAGYWMSTTSLLGRFEIAELIAYHDPLLDLLEARTGVDGTDLAASFDAIEAAVLPGGVSADIKTAALDHAAANAMTNRQRMSALAHMLFCSPDFMRY